MGGRLASSIYIGSLFLASISAAWVSISILFGDEDTFSLDPQLAAATAVRIEANLARQGVSLSGASSELFVFSTLASASLHLLIFIPPAIALAYSITQNVLLFAQRVACPGARRVARVGDADVAARLRDRGGRFPRCGRCARGRLSGLPQPRPHPRGAVHGTSSDSDRSGAVRRRGWSEQGRRVGDYFFFFFFCFKKSHFSHRTCTYYTPSTSGESGVEWVRAVARVIGGDIAAGARAAGNLGSGHARHLALTASVGVVGIIIHVAEKLFVKEKAPPTTSAANSKGEKNQ
jgi:hypothetical protein